MNDNYHILLLLSLTIGEKTLTYYFKVRRNACARKVGWRSRPFLSKFFPPFFRFRLSVHSFLSFPGLPRSWIFHGKAAKQMCNKPRNICACHISSKRLCTAASLSLFLIILSHLSLYIFSFLFLFHLFRVLFLFLSCAPRAVCTVKNSESSLKRARKK